MKVCHLLIQEIQNGYRTEKPSNTPNFIADIMADLLETGTGRQTNFVGQLESFVPSSHLNMNDKPIQIFSDWQNCWTKNPGW